VGKKTLIRWSDSRIRWRVIHTALLLFYRETSVYLQFFSLLQENAHDDQGEHNGAVPARDWLARSKRHGGGMKQLEAKITPQGKPRLTEDRLVQLCEATGNKAEAAKWRKKLEERKAAEKKP
jgi:hypothetical protein